MALCRHKRKGIVTNQTGPFDPNRHHASAQSCDRPECIVATGRWVSGRTGEPAFWQADARKGVWINVNELPA